MSIAVRGLGWLLVVGLASAGCGESQTGGRDHWGQPAAGLDGDAAAPRSSDGTPGRHGGPGAGGASDLDGGLSGSDGGVSGGNPEPVPVLDPTQGEKYGEWTWIEVPGAVCRDGSPAGYYVREGSSDNLHIFLNGGGACADKFFCSLNPANVNENLPHEQLINATGNLLIGPDPIRQVPPDDGIFKRDPKNPVADWDAIFIPYCTGDVHAGTRNDVVVPGAENEGMNQFVGYKNVGLFLDSFGPYFKTSSKVLLSGSSAGSFGAIMNFDRVQTYFDRFGAKVYVVADSGIPMRDGVNGVDYMAPCLQKQWRELWGFNNWLPKECKGCFREDGGGLVEGLGAYLFHEKYPNRFFGGMVSTAEDNVIRAFFGAGGSPTDPNDNCMVDPGANTIASATIGGVYDGPTYRAGLKDAIDNVVGRDIVAFYVMTGTPHMHIWRSRYYEENGLGKTIADWVADVLQDQPVKLGDL